MKYVSDYYNDRADAEDARRAEFNNILSAQLDRNDVSEYDYPPSFYPSDTTDQLSDQLPKRYNFENLQVSLYTKGKTIKSLFQNIVLLLYNYNGVDVSLLNYTAECRSYN